MYVDFWRVRGMFCVAIVITLWLYEQFVVMVMLEIWVVEVIQCCWGCLWRNMSGLGCMWWSGGLQKWLSIHHIGCYGVHGVHKHIGCCQVVGRCQVQQCLHLHIGVDRSHMCSMCVPWGTWVLVVCKIRWIREGDRQNIWGSRVFVHFLDKLTLACVSNGLGLCVKGSLVRCNATSRQYWNHFVKTRIIEGV